MADVQDANGRTTPLAVHHHDGRAWKKRNPPRRLLKLDRRECIEKWPDDHAGDPDEECPAEVLPLELAALPGDDVLVRYDLDPLGFGLASKRSRLLRWDGRRWTRFGKDLPWSLRRLTGDGSGGFWAIASRWTATSREREFVLHLTRSGRLLKYPLPGQKSRDLTYTDISVSRSGTVIATGYIEQNPGDARHYVWKLTGHR